MKRRNFISRISLLLATFAGAFAGITFLKQFSPGDAGKGKRVKVGKLTDFPVDTYTFVEEFKLYVYRDHEAIKSVSAICTHLGCTLLRTTDGFECPCHGSCFSSQGKVMSGPAPTALAWYKMERAPDGMIVVDLGTVTDHDEKFYLS